MLLQSAAMLATKLLVDGKITAWVIRQTNMSLGNICNEVLDSQTLSDEKFCFLGNVCYQYLNFMLLVKLIAADCP